jgi:hypothetical protein
MRGGVSEWVNVVLSLRINAPVHGRYPSVLLLLIEHLT